MYDDQFYGFFLRDFRIRGLSAKLVNEKLVLSDKQGPKWEIRLITDYRISLYHRNEKHFDDDREAFHFQRVWNAPTAEGVRIILNYVDRHEDWGRGKVRNNKELSQTTQ